MQWSPKGEGFTDPLFETLNGIDVILFSGQFRYSIEFVQEVGQCRLHRFPYHLDVNLEVSVSDAIAHSAHTPPRYLRMPVHEARITVHHLGGSFADDDQTQL